MEQNNNKRTNNGGSDRTKCEVYSRVVGYLRPVDQWNNGKSAEYSDRVTFESNVDGCCNSIQSRA